MANSNFNQNFDGFAPNMPCVPTCPNRNPYCKGTCDLYKEWRIAQKHYSNKVRWERKNRGLWCKI